MRYMYYYYFKGNASRLALKSLVYVEQRDRLGSAVVYFQQSDFRSFTVQKIQYKDLRYVRCDWRCMIRKGNASTDNSEFPLSPLFLTNTKSACSCYLHLYKIIFEWDQLSYLFSPY
jgi:hypothetical protein